LCFTDLVEAIIEEANSSTIVPSSEPLVDSTDPQQPASLISQVSNTGLDVVSTSGVKEANDDDDGMCSNIV